MTEILSIQKLSKQYDGLAAVKDATFDIAVKDIVAITGENGAGKTTLFNLITGLQKPDDGRILFKGKELTGFSPLQRARLGMSRLYQHPRLFRNLAVWENVVSAAEINPGSSVLWLLFNPIRTRKADQSLKFEAVELLRQFRLDHLADRTAGELSFGERKLISFCMIAFRKTDLALLDEPFAGLNPIMIERMAHMVKQLCDDGMTFLLIEHNVSQALAIAHRHIEMVGGVSREVAK